VIGGSQYRMSHAEVTFVGREVELRTLAAQLDEAVAGSGRLVLLAGDAGIGKTRLTEELASLARVRNVAVCSGRCYEGEGAPAF
jgi:eukaryotic-like serine/threonine-protein kinase